MFETLDYYSAVVDSLAPGLGLLFALLLAGRIAIMGSRMVARAFRR